VPFLDNADWITAHRRKFQSAFEQINALGEASLSLLASASVHDGDLREMLVSSLFARSLEHFNSVIHNSETGWLAPTQVALRALIESVFTLRAVATNDDVRERYLLEDDVQRLAMLRKLERAETPALRKHLDPDLKQKLEETVAGNKIGALRTEFLAEKAGLLEWYLVVYSCLTGPAHSKIRDLQRYVQSSEPEPLEFALEPSDDDTLGLLSTAGNALLFAIETFQELFGVSIDADVRELRRLFQRWGTPDA
jgi:hypothetical protein